MLGPVEPTPVLVEVVSSVPVWQVLLQVVATLVAGFGGVLAGVWVSNKSQERIEAERIQSIERLEALRREQQDAHFELGRRNAVLKHEVTYLTMLADKIAAIVQEVNNRFYETVKESIELNSRFSDERLARLLAELRDSRIKMVARSQGIGGVLTPEYDEAFSGFMRGISALSESATGELSQASSSRPVDLEVLHAAFRAFHEGLTLPAMLRASIVNKLAELGGSDARYAAVNGPLEEP